VLANTAATINAVADDRFVLGLGTSSNTIIEGWHGLQFDRPLARVRETTELVNQMLTGEKTAFDGETVKSHGYRQQNCSDIPVYLAALGPKMLELAAEIAGGVILHLFPAPALKSILGHIESGAQRAGKTMQDVEVVSRFQVAVTNNKAAAFEQFRNTYIPYFATPVYNRLLAWTGYPEQAEQIRTGWKEKDRQKTAAALSDELIDSIAIIGSREECHKKIYGFMQAGINTPIITCVSPDPETRRNTIAAFSKDAFDLPK
jgi:alkanesulfonate monooxygenase SsuD/methylene tetrahydromethanopterin reductase-like flavin-dependent oxidoreductase (luciferase family)